MLFSDSDLQLWLEFQHFVRRGDQVFAAAAQDVGQVMAQTQTQQLVAHELASRQSTALLRRQLPRPGHQLEGDHVGIRVVVRGTLGQHMPDDDEQLTGNGDDGLVLFHAVGGRHSRSNSAFQKPFVSTACQAASTST